MAVWQKTFYINIGDKVINTTDIFPSLDKFLKRDWGGDELQCWGEPSSNDILVTWDKETREIDNDIRVRIDAGNVQIEFIQQIINFIKDRGFKLKTNKEEFIEPELSEIAKSLADSNADKFVSDPIKF